MSGALQRHPFSGLVHSAGELLHRFVRRPPPAGAERPAGSGGRAPPPPPAAVLSTGPDYISGRGGVPSPHHHLVDGLHPCLPPPSGGGGRVRTWLRIIRSLRRSHRTRGRGPRPSGAFRRRLGRRRAVSRISPQFGWCRDRREGTPPPFTSRIPFFFGWTLRSVATFLSHSLAGFDFHDHRPAVCMDQRPFWAPRGRALRRSNPAFGSSRIASPAYQEWPTGNPAFDGRRATRSARRALPI